jgi:hypothetical protein
MQGVTYRQQSPFAISLEATRTDVGDVALQGIEFWSSICDEEIALAIEASEAAERVRASRHYAKGGLQYLIPILCEMLMKHEDSDDDYDCNRAKVAAACLSLLANRCEDAVVQHIRPLERACMNSISMGSSSHPCWDVSDRYLDLPGNWVRALSVWPGLHTHDAIGTLPVRTSPSIKRPQRSAVRMNLLQRISQRIIKAAAMHQQLSACSSSTTEAGDENQSPNC